MLNACDEFKTLLELCERGFQMLGFGCMGLTCLEDTGAGHGMLRVCWHSRRSEAHRSLPEARP